MKRLSLYTGRTVPKGYYSDIAKVTSHSHKQLNKENITRLPADGLQLITSCHVTIYSLTAEVNKE